MKKIVLLIFLAALIVLPAGSSALCAQDFVEVTGSRTAFEAATGARPLPFPSSADVLPYHPFDSFSGYSCIKSPPGISLPTGAPKPLATIQLAVDNEWICFLGPDWTGGLSNINPEPRSPTIAANGEDDYLIRFAAPVYAAGVELLTNSTAKETVTLNFADGSHRTFDTFESEPNGFQFIGFYSLKPIVSILINTENGTLQNEGIVAILASFGVGLEIKPCSDPSPVNLKSKGVLPAAILGSDILDVSLIDPATVTLQGLAPKEPGNSGRLLCRIQDSAGAEGHCGPDGFPDLFCHFQMGDSEQNLESGTWWVHAQTFAGTALSGYDEVKVIKPPSLDSEDKNDGKAGSKDKEHEKGKSETAPGQTGDKPDDHGKGKEKDKG